MRELFAIVFLLMPPVTYADWGYSEDTDRMTSRIYYEAAIRSNNSLRLDFPYKGDNFGQITVRQHPKHGLNVIISIDKGQILCSSYSGCPIEIRFDDKPAIRFSGTGPADNSSDTVFLSNTPRFISEAKKAKRILVSMNIYKSGAPVLEFSTASTLQWGKKTAEPAKKPATPAKVN